MTWKQLLAERKIQPHRTSKQELDALRALVARDLQDATLPGLSADRPFATAYNAGCKPQKWRLRVRGIELPVSPAIIAFSSKLLVRRWGQMPNVRLIFSK